MPESKDGLDRTLHAIADPKRREILQILKERGQADIGKEIGLCASDIEARVRLSQPTVSHHMAILVRAGLIEGRKLGQWVWYRRNEKAIRVFAQNLKKAL